MRFVIRSANGAFFTEFEVKASRSVTLNGAHVGFEQDLAPKFEAFSPRHAAKFDSQADAETQIANADPLLGGPAAFAGCTVQSTEE
jgi:hypothetical protein